jgi:hypothetical protein
MPQLRSGQCVLSCPRERIAAFPQQTPSGKTTGKLPVGQIANHCPALSSEIFPFPSDPNQPHIPGCPILSEGRFAIVTNVGDGMRWTRQCRACQWRAANGDAADGEIVWS